MFGETFKFKKFALNGKTLEAELDTSDITVKDSFVLRANSMEIVGRVDIPYLSVKSLKIGDIQLIVGKCTYCNNDDKVLIGKLNPCIECIRDCVIQHQARESWNSANGDPILAVRSELTKYKEDVAFLKKEIEELRKRLL